MSVDPPTPRRVLDPQRLLALQEAAEQVSVHHARRRLRGPAGAWPPAPRPSTACADLEDVIEIGVEPARHPRPGRGRARAGAAARPRLPAARRRARRGRGRDGAPADAHLRRARRRRRPRGLVVEQILHGRAPAAGGVEPDRSRGEPADDVTSRRAGAAPAGAHRDPPARRAAARRAPGPAARARQRARRQPRLRAGRGRRTPDGLGGHRAHDRAARARPGRRPGAGDLGAGRPVAEHGLRHRRHWTSATWWSPRSARSGSCPAGWATGSARWCCTAGGCTACRPAPAGPRCTALLHVADGRAARQRGAGRARPGRRHRRCWPRARRRRGMRVVVSDFLDAGRARDPDAERPWERPMRRLAARHQVLAVEVIDPRELELPDVGMVTFTDPETGRAARCTSPARSARRTPRRRRCSGRSTRLALRRCRRGAPGAAHRPGLGLRHRAVRAAAAADRARAAPGADGRGRGEAEQVIFLSAGLAVAVRPAGAAGGGVRRGCSSRGAATPVRFTNLALLSTGRAAPAGVAPPRAAGAVPADDGAAGRRRRHARPTQVRVPRDRATIIDRGGRVAVDGGAGRRRRTG